MKTPRSRVSPAVFRFDEILADHNKHKIRHTTVFTAPKTA
jgi:hypothetical protein